MRRRRFKLHIPRTVVFYGLLAGLLAVIIGRLFDLQVRQYETYVSAAVENRITRVNDPAPRGVIYDRRGVLLARNLPSFIVTITPAFLPDNEAQVQAIVRRLAELLDAQTAVRHRAGPARRPGPD